VLEKAGVPAAAAGIGDEEGEVLLHRLAHQESPLLVAGDEGFLAEDVDAGVEGAVGLLGVAAVRRAEDDGVGKAGGEQINLGAEDAGPTRKTRGHVCEGVGIGIGDGDDVDMFREQAVAVQFAHETAADDGDTRAL
jgi:hypothetical protein